MAQAVLKQENYIAQNDIESSELLGKEDQKSRFIHLRAKGLSYAKIAKELKVSTSTLSNWNQDELPEWKDYMDKYDIHEYYLSCFTIQLMSRTSIVVTTYLSHQGLSWANRGDIVSGHHLKCRLFCLENFTFVL